MKSQATIVPVGISGTDGMNSPLHVFRPTGRLRINIGRAFTLPDIEGRPSAAVLQSMTDMIMSRVAMMLPPAYQGVYRIGGEAAKQGITPAHTTPLASTLTDDGPQN